MCEIEDRLERAHQWMHLAACRFDTAEWEQAKQLALEILDLLNETQVSHGVKLIAIGELVMLGSEVMDGMEVSQSIQ